MKAKEVLSAMDIGNSVAEFDIQLQSYFLETQIYKDFIKDKYDILSGDKGTGKTAIYKIVRDRYRSIPELSEIEIIAGFNDSGNPVFQRLSQAEVLSEAQYITVWKAYIISLIGNYLLDIYEGNWTDSMWELDKILKSLDIRSNDSSALTIFSQLSNLLRRITHPSSVQVKLSITPEGMPIVIPSIEFSSIKTQEVNAQKIINSDDALQLLNLAVSEIDLKFWLVLDRLDEAFVGFQSIEIPCLRALLRTYLDMQAYDYLKLKLFVRNDLFRKIIRGGFVNLTHINAKRISITWDTEDLYALLCQRIRECEDFLHKFNLDYISENDKIFTAIFPEKVDVGEKKPLTWHWILSRIQDGNGLLAPRNLIDLVNKTKEAQIRREQRSPRELINSSPLFEADSLRKGLSALSEQRVQDTLLAESGDYAQYIEAFRNGKAEHNYQTLTETMGISQNECEPIIQELKELGFLEKFGNNFKIPMLFRSGLNITQGKAFEITSP